MRKIIKTVFNKNKYSTRNNNPKERHRENAVFLIAGDDKNCLRLLRLLWAVNGCRGDKNPLEVLIAGVAERLCTRLQTELEGFDSPLPLNDYFSKKTK